MNDFTRRVLEWERRVSVRTGLYARPKTIVLGDRAYSIVSLMTMPTDPWSLLILSLFRTVVIHWFCFFLFFTFFINHVDSIVVHYILKQCRYRGVSVLVSTLVNWCNISNSSNNITCYQPRSSFVPVPRDIKGHRSVRDAVITALFPRWRVTNGTVVGGTACVLNVHWSLRDNGLWLLR